MKYFKYFGIHTRDRGELKFANSVIPIINEYSFLKGPVSRMNKAYETNKDMNQYCRYHTLLLKMGL